MKHTAYLIIALFCSTVLHAQYQDLTVQQYVDRYKDVAIAEMKRSGVPASITLAQGILESENGNGDLVRKSNNHFGIKCKSSWTGNSVSHDDDARGECFRKYDSDFESFTDHSDFLKNSPRYASLFLLDPRDYKAWCYGLKKAGYATNPRYPEMLIKHIEYYDLQQFTLIALNEEQKVPDLAYSPGMGYSAANDPGADQSSSTANSMNEPRTEYYYGLSRIYVSGGTSLLALAARLNMPLMKLLDFNDLDEDGLLPANQWIYLERKKNEGMEKSYLAANGETAWDVAQVNGVQLKQLLAYNPGISGRELVAGKNLWLKPGYSLSVEGGGQVTVHTVKRKENLFAISKQYNVSVDDLRKWNNLPDNHIKTGQELIISK